MAKVFIGGSRQISRLTAPVLERLHTIMEKEFPVIVGDSYHPKGADKAVQDYFFSKGYQNVEVFCSGSIFRNNIGHWNTRNIDTATHVKGRASCTVKDRAMALEATYGFMVWDGKSPGTLLNGPRISGRASSHDRVKVSQLSPFSSQGGPRARQGPDSSGHPMSHGRPVPDPTPGRGGESSIHRSPKVDGVEWTITADNNSAVLSLIDRLDEKTGRPFPVRRGSLSRSPRRSTRWLERPGRSA